MNQIITIPVDFGNADEDGAVRLVTEGSVEHLRFHNIELSEGMKVIVSDGELTADGTCTKRDNMWVVLVERWTKYDLNPKL
jgi:hypothetical protein